jgi:hypothetical protein
MAEMVIRIGEVGPLADHPDRHAARPEGAADAGIEHRRLAPRIGADDEDGVGPVDAGNAGVEQIAGPAAAAAERRMRLAAIDMGHLEALHHELEGEHLLDRGEIADQRRHARWRGGLDPLGGQRQRLRPAGRAQPAAVTDIGPIEALRLQPVPDEAGLVGDPLLVHVLMGARQDPHHLATARIEADVGADRVHHVDRFDLAQLPGAPAELVGS